MTTPEPEDRPDEAPALDDTGNADEQAGDYVDDDELDDDDEDQAEDGTGG